MNKRSNWKHHKAEVSVLPPDFRNLGNLPFDTREREELAAWLGEARWPRESMDMEALEGYLVALLVWPVDLPSGAWLPEVWGERGWKFPAKLADMRKLDRFVALIGGFLQDLDRRVTNQTDCYVPTLRPAEARQEWRPRAPSRWAQGFVGALQQHSYGLKYRSMAARRAAESIARSASWTPTPETEAELSRAVQLLAAERPSRGPLGPLLHHASGAELAERTEHAAGPIPASK